MMRHSRYLVLIAAAVAVLQIGLLASMIMGRAAILRSGQEISLRMLPVDPRDLLRGDYVVINYDISTIDSALVEQTGPAPAASSYEIFVRVRRQDDGAWVAVAARYGEPPRAPKGDGDVDMRGTTYSAPDSGNVRILVDYGIERFYVPEGEGRPIETSVGERSFTMRVAVADDGRAQIKALYDGETLIFSEPLY